MKTKLLMSALSSLVVSATITVPAEAAMIAGWDFSQYFGAGNLSVDGVGYTNVLSANYSNLDPTFGAGAESSAFGTLYFDGSFGSTNVDPNPGTGLATVVPQSLSLAANINAPVVGGGPIPFDSFAVLQDEGQLFADPYSFQALSSVSFVFAAYTNTVPGLGSEWSLTFGGGTVSGTSTIGIEFSTDGVTYTPVGTQELTAGDSQYSVTLGALPSEAAFVRFNVNPLGVDTRIDNVAINGSIVVPEPGTATLFFAALAAFATVVRRRA